MGRRLAALSFGRSPARSMYHNDRDEGGEARDENEDGNRRAKFTRKSNNHAS